MIKKNATHGGGWGWRAGLNAENKEIKLIIQHLVGLTWKSTAHARTVVSGLKLNQGVLLILSIFYPFEWSLEVPSLKPRVGSHHQCQHTFTQPHYSSSAPLRPSPLTPRQSLNNWGGQRSMAQAVLLVRNPLPHNPGRLTGPPPPLNPCL